MPFRITELSSSRNPFLQHVRLAASSGSFTADGLILVEGPHLLREIANSSWQIEKLLFTREAFAEWEPYARGRDVETILIPARTFSSLASTETNRGAMALARPPAWQWADFEARPALVVALDNIQDPGNAGTIIRSAEAFGATGIVLLDHSARLSNGKLMRASAGSLFRLPILDAVSYADFTSAARENKWNLAALNVSAGEAAAQFSFHRDCALIVGNEGRGVSPQLLRSSTSVNIPASRVESLNAAVACSIALYEASRQRRQYEPL